jgi:hypothetical protein
MTIRNSLSSSLDRQLREEHFRNDETGKDYSNSGVDAGYVPGVTGYDYCGYSITEHCWQARRYFALFLGIFSLFDNRFVSTIIPINKEIGVLAGISLCIGK